MSITGKRALVTGSSQGIGQTIAQRLAEEGCDVIIHYHSHPETAEETAEGIRKLGRKAVLVQADLSTTEGTREVVQKSIEGLAGLDLLVNNAGLEKHANFWDVTERDYDLVLNTDLRGAFFTTQAFVKHLMAEQRPGKIINVSSVHEELPFPHFTAYCASKGGMKMMMRNLAIELAPFGITINNVAPGAIETPINKNLLNDPEKLKALLENIPLKRLGKTTDVAGVVAFLASTDADYITGTTIVVDGGLTWNYSEQ
jgi:glucose 1-dehydrogenase